MDVITSIHAAKRYGAALAAATQGDTSATAAKVINYAMQYALRYI